MNGNKQIIILHSVKEFKLFNQLENEFYLKKKYVIIAYSIELRLYLKNLKIPYNIQEEYMDYVSRVQLDKKANSYSMNWHEDLFQYKGVSLGLLLQFNLYQYFARILRNTQNVLNIINHEKPAIILFFEQKEYYIDEFNKILTHICSHFKIELKIISNKSLNSKVQEKSYLNHNVEKNNNILSIFFKILNPEIIYSFFSRILTIFKKLFSRKRKNIFVTNINYHSSILKDIGKRFKLKIMSTSITKECLVHNLRNLFLKHNKFDFLFLDTYSNKKIYRKTQRDFRYLFHEWKGYINRIKRNFYYNGISLWPVVRWRIFRVISGDLKAKIRQVLVHELLLKREKINLMITGNDAKDNLRSLTILCKKHNIPTLLLQHGMLSGVEDFIPSFSSFYGIWGKNSKKILRGCGISNKKLYITGAPRFDKYLFIINRPKFLKKIKDSVHKDFAIGRDKKILLLTTTYGGIYYSFNMQNNLFDIETILTIPIKAMRSLNDYHLIIKLHPGDKLDHIPKRVIRNENIKNVTVTKTYNIFKLIAASDGLITSESTTILEALLLQKPVYCLKIKNFNYFSPILKYNLINVVSNPEELASMVRDLNFISVDEFRNLLKDYLYRLDGKSTQRVNKLIYKILRTNW